MLIIMLMIIMMMIMMILMMLDNDEDEDDSNYVNDNDMCFLNLFIYCSWVFVQRCSVCTKPTMERRLFKVVRMY